MGSTQISYVSRTWNPIEGCAPCSPGCERCWARGWAHRAAANPAFTVGHHPGICGRNPYSDIALWDGTLAEFPARWKEPLHWRKPQRVFVGSRSDIALWPDRAFPLLFTVQNSATQHNYMWLTKRPELLAVKLSGYAMCATWLGVTVCNQAEADEKIPQLLAIHAAGHWVSVEPMLGPVDVSRWLPDAPRPDGQRNSDGTGDAFLGWVVCGGESGKGARPLNPDWVRALRDQCREAGVPFWFKQWGDAKPWTMDTEFDAYEHAGGWTTIDAVEWHQLPAELRLPGEGE